MTLVYWYSPQNCKPPNMVRRGIIAFIMVSLARFTKYIKYPLIIAVATFLAFGGPTPEVKTFQAGNSTTIRNYGQPFNFHANAIATSIGGQVSPLGSTGYHAKQFAVLAADITICGSIIWVIVRMAEQKPLRFWRSWRKKTPKNQAEAEENNEHYAVPE